MPRKGLSICIPLVTFLILQLSRAFLWNVPVLEYSGAEAQIFVSWTGTLPFKWKPWKQDCKPSQSLCSLDISHSQLTAQSIWRCLPKWTCLSLPLLWEAELTSTFLHYLCTSPSQHLCWAPTVVKPEGGRERREWEEREADNWWGRREKWREGVDQAPRDHDAAEQIWEPPGRRKDQGKEDRMCPSLNCLKLEERCRWAGKAMQEERMGPEPPYLLWGVGLSCLICKMLCLRALGGGHGCRTRMVILAETFALGSHRAFTSEGSTFSLRELHNTVHYFDKKQRFYMHQQNKASRTCTF